MQTHVVVVGLLAGTMISLLPAGAVRAEEADASKLSQRLVADALRAELNGNTAQRRILLSEAIDTAPNYAPARWQSGQVLSGDEWLPVDKAQEIAASDPKRAEYESLRAAGSDSLDGQVALARWCRKNGFDDEAKFHWRAVLAQQPNNEEALKALGVRWSGGRLVTPADILAAKAALRESKRAAKEFAPQMARWDRLLSAGDIKSRDLALEEIRALRETAAIAAVEEVTLDGQLATNDKFERSLEVGQAFVAALDQMPDRAATQSLLRHAVFAPVKSVRAAAIESLKKRPPHDYVPQLLMSLTMPIESSHRIVTDTDGSVHYFQSLYREGPAADWSFEGRLSAMQLDLHGPTYVTLPGEKPGEQTRERFGAANNPVVRAEIASVAGANQQRFGNQANVAERQIAEMNRSTKAANAAVIPVLMATTNEDFGDNPRAWWDWWLRYNEVSSDGEHPVQEQRYADSTHRYYRPPREVTVRPWRVPDKVGRIRFIDIPLRMPPPIPHECFAAGTPVWTRIGLRPIESLEIGEFVLAQSVETGELSYKPVLGRTVRQPSPCRRLVVGKDTLVAVPGHPFWVAGVGWRMAKDLEDGVMLHAVNGPVPLESIEDGESVDTYNLVVADFNNYFVGKAGVLVHDNTPRQPTTALVPGLVGQ